MHITTLNSVNSNFKPTFRWEMDAKLPPSKNGRTVSHAHPFGDEFHPQVIKVEYHENCKLAKLNFK